MILYLDTSAVVKLYADETGSDRVRAAVAEAKLCVTHLIAYVETRAAFARKAQQPGYRDCLQSWHEDFERDWPSFEIVGVTQELMHRAGDLAEAHRLRGYDSVHLAAAEALWRVADGLDFRFLVFDGDLANAAKGMGIRLCV
jgi:predicted nucleic acid-binding protein